MNKRVIKSVRKKLWKGPEAKRYYRFYVDLLDVLTTK